MFGLTVGLPVILSNSSFEPAPMREPVSALTTLLVVELGDRGAVKMLGRVDKFGDAVFVVGVVGSFVVTAGFVTAAGLTAVVKGFLVVSAGVFVAPVVDVNDGLVEPAPPVEVIDGRVVSAFEPPAPPADVIGPAPSPAIDGVLPRPWMTLLKGER